MKDDAENLKTIEKYLSTANEIKNLIESKELFIFDLDGTMFNSLGDLAPAVNYALRQFGIQEISKDNVRSCIGNGSRNLIRRSVASGMMSGTHLNVRDAEAVAAILEKNCYDEAKIDEVLKTYSGYYWEHCTEDTEPYEGVLKFIDWICSSEGLGEGKKIAAMLTNKPVLPAKKILEKFGLLGNAGFAAGSERPTDKITYYLCGDTTPERKPGPGGIYAILKELNIAPEKAVMIGDDTPDVLAARNAGIDSIICLEGFGRPENLLPLEPKYTIGHIKDLLKSLQ